ncbi:unnamed protein product [Paramecium sonneborni]|uniref:Uncharacterized protein n=1 Tax=Paramecium sonneborni TaxID=65129 RepID=A0A8S1M6E4_9CILI|nr:unnamed protein product [Paramecium sonneborni]
MKHLDQQQYQLLQIQWKIEPSTGNTILHKAQPVNNSFIII